MLFLAQNKRKVLASFLTVIVLLAIGFGVGRLTANSTSTAQAATPASSKVVAALRRQVASAHSVASIADTRLATERSHSVALTNTVSVDNARLAAVDRCFQVDRTKPVRRCVEDAVR